MMTHGQALTPLKFLVIDDNADSRTLLAKTLLRKFPDCVVQECQHGDTAVATVARERLAAVIAHRTFDCDGETLIRIIRAADADVPIVMVSGHDKQGIARGAGADAFLNYDAWLTVGTIVAAAMAKRRSTPPKAAPEPESDDLAEPETV